MPLVKEKHIPPNTLWTYQIVMAVVLAPSCLFNLFRRPCKNISFEEVIMFCVYVVVVLHLGRLKLPSC